MRSVTLSRRALETNLAQVLSTHGPDVVVDLRANAYGLGVDSVAAVAKKVGLRRAYFGEGSSTDLVSVESPHGSIDGWWSGSGGEVVTFRAEVISVKRVPANTPVSYGYHYRTSDETTLALVCVGYADGVPRTASGAAHVGLHAHRVGIAGRIAMDQCVLDVGETNVAVGDHVTVWGEFPTLSEWANWSGRPEGALLTHIGARVSRRWE